MRFRIQTQRNLSHAIEWIHCCFILHNLIVDIERELKLDSSLAEFREEAPVEEENSGADEDQEDGNEEPEVNDDLATSTGQAFRRQVMNILLENM
jgi:hypothetical protein